MPSDVVYAPPRQPWLQVVYRDRDVLALDKPAGLLSVPGRRPGWEDSAVTRLGAEEPTARVVHRLDMDTSGLLLFALRRKAERALKEQFRNRAIDKRYLAWVAGHPDDSGRVELAMRRVGGDPPRNVVDPAGKSACTDFRVLARRDDRALVELRPRTGRSHQLRVHMAALGHPILGDRFYAPPAVQALAPRLLLHAWRLSLLQPWSGAPLRLEAPCPFDGPPDSAAR